MTMTTKYEQLRIAVEKAGFFTNGVENHGTWDRTCVCSTRSPDGTLSGNSFWVTRLPDNWYVGAWGGWVYRLPDESRIAEFCITWLTKKPRGTAPDFDGDIKKSFDLKSVSDEEFNLKTGRADLNKPELSDDEKRSLGASKLQEHRSRRNRGGSAGGGRSEPAG
jgi:hypothetical protein